MYYCELKSSLVLGMEQRTTEGMVWCGGCVKWWSCIDKWELIEVSYPIKSSPKPSILKINVISSTPFDDAAKREESYTEGAKSVI